MMGFTSDLLITTTFTFLYLIFMKLITFSSFPPNPALYPSFSLLFFSSLFRPIPPYDLDSLCPHIICSCSQGNRGLVTLLFFPSTISPPPLPPFLLTHITFSGILNLAESAWVPGKGGGLVKVVMHSGGTDRSNFTSSTSKNSNHHQFSICSLPFLLPLLLFSSLFLLEGSAVLEMR